MVELADTYDSRSYALVRTGSTPVRSILFFQTGIFAIVYNMDKSLIELKDELETVCLRFNCVQEEMKIKISEGDILYQRKIDLIDKIDRLEDE